MNEEPLEKQKVRIIEIDRKLAAHLADVCNDMNRMIKKSTESLKKEKKQRKTD